jgi:hypothetical protein
LPTPNAAVLGLIRQAGHVMLVCAVYGMEPEITD